MIRCMEHHLCVSQFSSSWGKRFYAMDVFMYRMKATRVVVPLDQLKQSEVNHSSAEIDLNKHC